ncbi:MAG: rod shape-determining protein MreD [Pseudomonadota bacterium]|nr:rod shape-determining protein MreD [Pseudomonadota bacterium]
MHDNFKDKLYVFFRHRIPLLATLILMFLFYVPIYSLELNYFRPAVGFICVYYWTLKRSYMFSYISAFIIGFFMDIYSSTPLGINCLMMLFLVFVTEMLARYFKAASFTGNWLVFSLAGLILTLIKWLLISVYFSRFVSISEVIVNLISTIMFYPLVVYFNIWIQNNLLPQERINE